MLQLGYLYFFLLPSLSSVGILSYWQSSAVCLELSVQKKNFPLKSCTPTMAKMSRNRMYTIRMLKTFFREITTQSNTAFSAGTRFTIFRGRSTRSSFTDFSFWPVGVPLEYREKNITKLMGF